jgi:hypothetical protein
MRRAILARMEYSRHLLKRNYIVGEALYLERFK